MKRVHVCVCNDSRIHAYLLGHTIYSFLVLASFCDKYRAVGILSSFCVRGKNCMSDRRGTELQCGEIEPREQ